ncbi:transport and Golgi organization protein 2 [Kordia periserrulae]|uniref:Transport and Golgi organization protein 2 n=1 Tax=Kordia periserrulae TaxID=701523 RepID=A0A2T6C5J2_9FLAO|nr:NRDE family protein [Kordia periserrulae]PTX63553.1 transport and Golgi organization protein 2 [Kordia periserrulae]
MCTVSFVYQGNDAFVLTSNRDESPARETIKPAIYSTANAKIVYPKDKVGGGTWIGMSNQKRAVCLLNAGFTAHKRLPAYRHSRGIVVKDFLTSTHIEKSVTDYNLHKIEPFTIIIVDWNTSLQLFELVWDGAQKHFQKLPLETPHIWSSSMLYSEDMKQLRRDWFSDFQQKNILNAASVMRFHKTAGIGNPEVDVIMDRFFVKTVSITQIEKTTEILSMKYHHLMTDATSELSFNSIQTLHE